MSHAMMALFFVFLETLKLPFKKSTAGNKHIAIYGFQLSAVKFEVHKVALSTSAMSGVLYGTIFVASPVLYLQYSYYRQI